MERINKEVSVVFPAFNERESIEACILVAHCALKEMVKNFEIIIVNDGSTDGTGDICESLAKKLGNIKVIDKKVNEGYGFALRDGFRAARYELAVFLDADRQFDIFNLKDLLRYADSYDVVVGYRKHREDPLQRKIFSFGYNMIIKLLFRLDVRDINCAFKLFKKDFLDKIELKSRQYFINTELLAKAKVMGKKVKEVPVAHFPRYEGVSKVGYSDIPRTLREIANIYKSTRSAK